MNTITKLAACAALTITSPLAFADGFVRPLVELVSPHLAGYSTKAGIGVVVGSQFGKQREHEISFECAGTQWNTAQVTSAGVAAVSERFVSYLVNYRYHFGSATAPVRFYVGPAVGLTNNNVSFAVARTSGVVADQDSLWCLTWSASAGLTWALSTRIDLDLGYRYLHVQPQNATLAGSAFNGETVQANVVYAGVGFRF